MCVCASLRYLLPFLRLGGVFSVSKSFDFIACEKDVLWLLLSLTNVELRHILRLSVCKFKFYVLF